jgi:hypothetical protein
MNFINYHNPHSSKHFSTFTLCRNEHHLHRLGRRQKNVGGILFDPIPLRCRNISMPELASAADHTTILFETQMEVV